MLHIERLGRVKELAQVSSDGKQGVRVIVRLDTRKNPFVESVSLVVPKDAAPLLGAPCKVTIREEVT